ncbi:MAG: hypothetical protein V4481_02280 [Patescibacteria group bacterium]
MEPTTTPKKSNKRVYFIIIALVVLILIIIAAVKSGRGVSSASAGFTNTKFGYELTLPSGWGIWSPSKDWDIGNRLSTTPKYQSVLVKYPSPQAFEKAEPQLSAAYAKDFDARAATWTPQEAQFLILTNSSTTPPGPFGQNKINVALAHFDAGFIEAITATSTNLNIIQPFVTKNGYKAFIRLSPLRPEDGDISGVVNLQFDGTATMEDGKTANGIVFLTSGHDAQKLLLDIANSFKSVK